MTDPNFDLNTLIERANSGDLSAQNSLGFHYESGEQIEQSEALANQWYERAARGGYAVAQYNLALGYERGRAGRQDDVEAARWYRRAARAGYPPAQHNLAQLYRRGRGVKRDIHRALAWYMRALSRGDHDAYLSLGRLYEHAQGVDRNLPLALELYRTIEGEREQACEGIARIEDDPELEYERERVRELLLRRKSSMTRLDTLLRAQPELRVHMSLSPRARLITRGMIIAAMLSLLGWAYTASLSSSPYPERATGTLKIEEESAIARVKLKAAARLREAQTQDLQAEVARLKSRADQQLKAEIQEIRDTMGRQRNSMLVRHQDATKHSEQQREVLLYVLSLTIAFFLERIFERLFHNKGYAILLVCLCGAIMAYFMASYSLLGVLVSGSVIGSKSS